MTAPFEDDWDGGWDGGPAPAPAEVESPAPSEVCDCGRGCAAGCGCRVFLPAGNPIGSGRARQLSALRDKANDMRARYGLSLYGVRIIRVRAVGARGRGDGADEVVGAWEILPLPKVMDMSSMTMVVTSAQVREQGTLLVTGISLEYTEDVLVGRGPDGTAIPPGEAVYWEIQFSDPLGRASTRRRFATDGPPYYDPAQQSWQVSLRLAHAGRTRGGIPRDGAT